MNRALLFVTSTFALLAGCAHSAPAESAARPAAVAQDPAPAGEMAGMCPMSVPGTQVAAADAVNGETLTFTATDRVADLRSRVHAMAEMHNKHHGNGNASEGMKMGGMKEGMMGSGKAMGSEMMTMPPSQATVADLENGASLTVVPNAPTDLKKLQDAVRMHAQKMQTGGCGMMGHEGS